MTQRPAFRPGEGVETSGFRAFRDLRARNDGFGLKAGAAGLILAALIEESGI